MIMLISVLVQNFLLEKFKGKIKVLFKLETVSGLVVTSDKETNREMENNNLVIHGIS